MPDFGYRRNDGAHDGSFDVDQPPLGPVLRSAVGRADALWFTPILPAYLMILGPSLFSRVTGTVVWTVMAVVVSVEAALVGYSFIKFRRHRKLREAFLNAVDARLAIYGYCLRRRGLHPRSHIALLDREEPAVEVTDLLDGTAHVFHVKFGPTWRFFPADRDLDGAGTLAID